MSVAQQIDVASLSRMLDPAAIEAEQCRRHLLRFVRSAWHVVEPQTVFVPSWHIDAICEHLEAVTRGDIRNLLINIPPRCMKSLLVAVFWPVWVWINAPATRWLFSSYTLSLSTRDSLKCRRLIESPWFQSRFGHVFELTSDQNAKIRFENDATGVRLATSVDGSATGEGGDVIIVDDPHHVKEALSDVVREAALLWWDEVMSTRLNDPETGAKVIVMQRLHEEDLAGHVLEQGGYEHLCLPMRYEPDEACATAIGFEDPRTEDGELLWAERFGEASVADLERTLGGYAAAGQLQQRPAPRGGGLFKVGRLGMRTRVPNGDTVHSRVRFWDKAGTEDGGAYTVGLLMARLVDGSYVVEDVARGQWSAGRREEIIRSTARSDGHDVEVGIEQEPGSGGKESAESTIRNLAGYVVKAERPTGDKAARADPFAIQVEGGNVSMLVGDWNHDYVEELRSFPVGRFSDQVDASSGAFNKLAIGREAGDYGVTV